MDSLITAAAQALASGDALGALNRVALRNDAPALALRGIAMAQLGDLVRAKALLRGHWCEVECSAACGVTRELSTAIAKPTSHLMRCPIPLYSTVLPRHSHSIVPGGLEVMSYVTRLIPAPRAQSVQLESAGRIVPCETSISSARESNQMEPHAVPSGWIPL
jgi:hypothetical protein